MKKCIAFLVFLLLISLTISSKGSYSFYAQVIGIRDGDTFEVLYEGKPVTIRLADVENLCGKTAHYMLKFDKTYETRFQIFSELIYRMVSRKIAMRNGWHLTENAFH